tara:strand:+ start:122 stop:1003 length:882 start_codon:yes stop_codon:yes gene_type:complete
MSLSSLVSRIVPTAIGLATGGPAGAFAATVATEKAKSEQKKFINEQNRIVEENRKRENLNMALPPIITAPPRPPATASSGFGSSFGDFLTQASTNILAPLGTFASGISSLFGRGTRPQSVATQPALTTITNVGAQESQGSGTNEAFIGGVPNIIGAARSLLRSPSGLTGAIGTAVGFGASLLDSSGRPLRITRKMKRLAQQAYQLAGMDIGGAMNIFAQLTGVDVDQRTFVMILTKRFRNDGAVVTKAALRKTRTTIRRLKMMSDTLDSLRPRARATRRTTTMKRANTTLIKN